MSTVNFTSGINNIEHYASLSEWAVNYIFTHKLTRENHINSEHYRNLPRRQKDAVRYQLKKGNFSTSNNRIAKARNEASKVPPSNSLFPLRIGLSIWISCFLIADIVQIYSAKGLSPWLAWQGAILIELCILAASTSSECRIRKLAYIFFIYNALLFSFSEINHLLQIKNRDDLRRESIHEAHERIKELNKSTKAAILFRDRTLSQMSNLISKGYISSASNAISKITNSTTSKEMEIAHEIKSLQLFISKQKAEREYIITTSLVSFLYFFLRCGLQIFSILILSLDRTTRTTYTSQVRTREIDAS